MAQVQAPRTYKPSLQDNFYNDHQDCLWLAATHLKGRDHPFFKSFRLIGNEDCPTEVILYADIDPLVSAQPNARINLLEAA